MHPLAELTIPQTTDDDAFRSVVDLGNLVDAHAYGTDELDFTYGEALNRMRDPYSPARVFTVSVGGRLVGRADVWQHADADAPEAWITVRVHPENRRQGIGSALLREVERIARGDGRRKLVAYSASQEQDGPRLAPPTGFGSLPADAPEACFAAAHGYRLEQIERGSRLPLPVAEGVLERMTADAAARAGDDYRVHTWSGRAPDRFRVDLAELLTRMSTDAPTAGIEETEDVWSLERLADAEERFAASGDRVRLTAAVEHVPSGRLVGFTDLTPPVDRALPAAQQATIVLGEHRGHRLGVLLKAANLVQLAEVHPGHPSVFTFNAEENRPMLDVNEAIGFVAIGYEGCWRKDV